MFRGRSKIPLQASCRRHAAHPGIGASNFQLVNHVVFTQWGALGLDGPRDSRSGSPSAILIIFFYVVVTTIYRNYSK